MKRALIIHGFGSNSREHWFQEEKVTLEKMGYQVTVPDMPHASEPVKEEWLEVVRKFKPSESDILIGHSLGAPTILRYLEEAENKVGKVFLLSAFAEDLNPFSEDKHTFDDINNFIVDTPFDWNKIKKNCDEFYVIHETNDPYVPKECGMRVAQNLSGNLVLCEGDCHFDKLDLTLINDSL